MALTSKKALGVGLNQPVYESGIFLRVIEKGFAIQRIGLKDMAKGLIERLAASKNIAQGEMATYGVAIRQLGVANECFDNGYKLLLGFYHRDLVVQMAASRLSVKEALESLYGKFCLAQFPEDQRQNYMSLGLVGFKVYSLFKLNQGFLGSAKLPQYCREFNACIVIIRAQTQRLLKALKSLFLLPHSL